MLFCLLLIVTYLFRGSYDYGMNYDEVLRLNPYMSLVHPGAPPVHQSIYSIKIGKVNLPIMFKEYISSITTAPMVPALFFEDPRFGLRLMEKLYFFIAVAAVFLFLKGYSFYLASATSMLLATAPYLYPEIRFGSVHTFHIIILVMCALFLRKALSHDRWIYWLLSGFALGLGINLLNVYFFWTLSGASMALALLFPREVWAQVKRFKVISLVAAGVILGSFNYLVYNLATGGDTFKPLFAGLFDRQAYNEAPIDYRELPPISQEVLFKLKSLSAILGQGTADLTLLYCGIALAGLIYLAALLVARRRRQLREILRLYYFPLLTTALTFALILITPKSGRAGHWAFMAPFPELSLAICSLLLYSYLLYPLRVKWRVAVAGLFAMMLIASTFSTTNSLVDRANATGGTRLFSPAIYQIHQDLASFDESGTFITSVDWGFSSQLYFLSRGELAISELCFRLVNREHDEAMPILARHILANYRPGLEMWFLYHETEALARTRANFLSFVHELGGRLEPVRRYTGGGNIHYLAKLEITEEYLTSLRASLVAREGHEAAPPVVKAYGPRFGVVGEAFNRQPGGESSMWFQMEHVNEFYVAYFNGTRQRTTLSQSKSLVTVAVDPEKIAGESAYDIEICDLVTKECSEEIFFPIVSPEEAPLIRDRIGKDLSSSSKAPVIGDYHPKLLASSEEENFAIDLSITLEGPGADLYVATFGNDNKVLAPRSDPRIVKFQLTSRDLQEGNHEVRVCEPATAKCSESIFVPIVPKSQAERLQEALDRSPDGAIAGPPVIKDYGPHYTTAGKSFNVQSDGSSAMWLQLEQIRDTHVVFFDGKTRAHGTNREEAIATIGIRHEELQRPMTHRLEICDVASGRCSAPVSFSVVGEGRFDLVEGDDDLANR